MTYQAGRSTAIAFGVAAAILLFALRELASGYSYWLDEAFSIDTVGRSWGGLLSIMLGDIHPPVYLALLKCWVAVVGASEIAARSLSLLLAIVAAGLVWLSARRHGEGAAAWALVFFAANPWFPYMASEVRSYALLWAFASAALYWVPHMRSVTWQWCLLGFLMAGTHYTGLMMFLALSGALFVFSLPNWIRALQIAAAALPSLLWPTVHFTFGRLAQGTATFHGESGETFWSLDSAAEGLGGAISQLPQSGLLLLAALTTALAWCLHSKRRTIMQTEAAVLIASVLLLILGIACIDLVRPISNFRYYLPALPFLAAAFGIMLGSNQSRAVYAGAATVLLLLSVIAGTTNLRLKSREGEDWKAAADSITAHGGGRVISTFPQPARVYLPPQSNTGRTFAIVGHVEGKARERLLARLRGWQPIFPVDERGFDPSQKVLVFCLACNEPNGPAGK